VILLKILFTYINFILGGAQMKTKEIPARVQMWYEEQVEVVKANFKKERRML